LHDERFLAASRQMIINAKTQRGEDAKALKTFAGNPVSRYLPPSNRQSALAASSWRLCPFAPLR
jgi:hypothetical protein